MNLEKTIELLKKHDLLKIIDEPLDINLEIPHIAYVEVKQEDSRAILFTNPIDKENDKTFDTPVLMNVFCSAKAVELLIGDANKIAGEIEELLKMKPPKGLSGKLEMFGKLFGLKNVPPKKLKYKGECQQVIKLGDDAKLSDLPVLTTWEQDAGPFITMGQVYTESLDGKMQNVGMYRLQVYNDGQLGMHWQIHKDSNHFFHEYKKAGKKMPVSIGIGGDPMYIWCGQAPLPIGVFELLLYGFVKKDNARLVKSITNDIYVPHDVDYVIEGFVDPDIIKIEGPFGDHTGYYTLEEEYPMMDVTCITSKKDPIFAATVVGKPPLEDKYMGYATERIFLPLLKTTAPDLIDYYMPENGVFHNLILAKINVSYPGHAQQMMHAFWGVGQMSFVKHAIFVGADAPELDDDEAITKWILNRLDVEELLITKGVVDALDHSSPRFALGGKMGLDCTGDEVNELGIKIKEDEKLLKKIKKIDSNVVDLKQYYLDTKNPICIVTVNKERSQKELFKELQTLFKNIKILVIVDEKNNDLDNLYMLLWRVVNNIDSNRDIFIEGHTIGIDATNKNKLDNFQRRWPDDVICTESVIEDLRKRGILDISDQFIKQFGLI
ncbi:MAG: menaquinone biosynthesis decarboxylase [Campylobacteraceae bacterium]|jgi:4-hydroxy-3-polyprenylbenzoate decarboxylase|nr:menaquinone biosynthesis decarboxylase [Campylobacteraceae bacterium]MBT4030169.1 menaquinone biosynthesis decarboxylase [Campylobacteraceae bacterium]MBT4179193.1 menaquinone biosynthesis decarboxylase [Campylobacteraceae bacterium]MBT4573056.1 menaquinone biosynthesis decarboxylase [Campylobacteraceae bacterium]MBT4707557.1 menaquinone biosynthesis decarboxylase [Campylobacteraceae bacterium]